MGKPNLPIYGLEELYLFPYYQTRGAYEQATGAACPVFDPTKPPKYWRDLTALLSTKRTVVYQQAVFGLRDGKPDVDLLVLPKEQAATVNIPPDKWGEPTEAPVPPPLRALEPDEELIVSFGGPVQVKNLVSPYWTEAAGGFTEEDRALLRAIARKLGL